MQRAGGGGVAPASLRPRCTRRAASVCLLFGAEATERRSRSAAYSYALGRTRTRWAVLVVSYALGRVLVRARLVLVRTRWAVLVASYALGRVLVRARPYSYALGRTRTRSGAHFRSPKPSAGRAPGSGLSWTTRDVASHASLGRRQEAGRPRRGGWSGCGCDAPRLRRRRCCRSGSGCCTGCRRSREREGGAHVPARPAAHGLAGRASRALHANAQAGPRRARVAPLVRRGRERGAATPGPRVC